MKKIFLTEDEFNYCRSSNLFSKYQENLFAVATQCSGMYLIELPEDDADEIRDICGEYLQIAGFDENYFLTEEGKILESLIDRFFID